jgi:hypothetical protein
MIFTKSVRFTSDEIDSSFFFVPTSLFVSQKTNPQTGHPVFRKTADFYGSIISLDI